MNTLRNNFVFSLALLVVACGSIEDAPLPLVDIPAKLQPPASETLKTVVPAVGVQIYECRVTQTGTHEWAFVAPEANLFDERGNKIGTHYVGPHWESSEWQQRGDDHARQTEPEVG